MKQSAKPILIHRGDSFFQSNIVARQSPFKGRTTLHWHDFYEMEIVLGGGGKYYVNGEEYPMQVGSCYLVTPIDFHRIDGDFMLMNIAFNETMVSTEIMNLLNAMNPATVVTFTEEEFQQFRVMLNRLLIENECELPLRSLAQRTLLESILIAFLRRTELSLEKKGRVDLAVMRVVSYIKFNFKKKLTLAEVAKAVHLTPNYIGEIFTKKMGITFNQYLMQTRLSHAKNLLLRGEMTVMEVAVESGFSSQTYFSDCFKREFGYSPSEARQVAMLNQDNA